MVLSSQLIEKYPIFLSSLSICCNGPLGLFNTILVTLGSSPKTSRKAFFRSRDLEAEFTAFCETSLIVTLIIFRPQLVNRTIMQSLDSYSHPQLLQYANRNVRNIELTIGKIKFQHFATSNFPQRTYTFMSTNL